MIPRAARHLVAAAAARAPLSAGGAPSLLADAAAAVAPASAAARPPAAPPARPFAAGKGQAALSRAGGPSMIRRGRVTSTGGGSGGVQSQRGQHSPGFVVQPYRGDLAAPSLAAALSSLEGLRYLRARLAQGVSSMWAIALCTRKGKTKGTADFKKVAAGIFERVCAASAAGDLQQAEEALTPTAMAALRADVKARIKAGWDPRMDWRLEGAPEVSVIQMRSQVMDRSLENGVVQATVRVKSLQHYTAFAAVEPKARKGAAAAERRRVAGTADGEPMPVRDLWVLEVPLRQGEDTWRLAAKLEDVPDGAVVPLS